MDEFDIQTVSDSENPSPSDSSELNSLQLVPDPESENGWRVEKNPSVSLVPVEEVYTEEQLRSMNGVEYAALSEQLSFLFPAVAGICLVCLLARCLKPRLRIPHWISSSLLTGLFFAGGGSASVFTCQLLFWRCMSYVPFYTCMGNSSLRNCVDIFTFRHHPRFFQSIPGS